MEKQRRTFDKRKFIIIACEYMEYGLVFKIELARLFFRLTKNHAFGVYYE